MPWVWPSGGHDPRSSFAGNRPSLEHSVLHRDGRPGEVLCQHVPLRVSPEADLDRVTLKAGGRAAFLGAGGVGRGRSPVEYQESQVLVLSLPPVRAVGLSFSGGDESRWVYNCFY